jgi:NRAMP (natural resistance-associated macrophage protein)-like metal ion transporter
VRERADMSGPGVVHGTHRGGSSGDGRPAASDSAVHGEAAGHGRGGIHGAFGSIGEHDEAPRRSWTARILTLLAIIGPGLIVMVGDNDAGGVATYAQAGQDYGLTLLWTLPLLIPVLVVNQEMVVRLGAVTGVGHARLIFERFGRFWGAFSVGDLFILNFLTIVTEFIGVGLALGYFGVSPDISVPLAAVGLVVITASGSFRRWERFMFVFVIVNFLVIPLVILAHPHAGPVLHDFVVPSVKHGFNSNSALLIIAIVGTTVAPWQLFFQQSNIIDKGITTRWVNYERTDTVIGSFVVVLGASLLVVTVAFAFAHTPLSGQFAFKDAGHVAHGLARYVGHGAGTIFSIILLNASIIGAAAVTLSTSYAFGDVFGVQHSLHRRVSEAKFFYFSYTAMVATAAAIVLIPGAPLGVITTSVQALAGVLLPRATVFLILLCNDAAVLGPWVNRPWVNAVATVVVSVLLVLSLILMTTTVFPGIDVTTFLSVLGVVLVISLSVAGIGYRRTLRQRPPVPKMAKARRETWRMPPLALLERPEWSSGRKRAMLVLRIYLVASVALLLVKAVQLG